MLQCFYFVTTVDLSRWNLSPDVSYDVSTIVCVFFGICNLPICNLLSPPSGHVQRALPARRGRAEPAQENAQDLQRLTRAPEWQERRSVQNQNLLLLALGDMGRGEGRGEGSGGHGGTSGRLNTPSPPELTTMHWCDVGEKVRREALHRTSLFLTQTSPLSTGLFLAFFFSFN